jgi:hypothetical protein
VDEQLGEAMRKLCIVLFLSALFSSSAYGMMLAGVFGAPAKAPNAPTSVVASAGDSQATITWAASTADGTHDAATQYDLYRSTTSGAETLVTSNVTSGVINTGLTNGTTYYYKIQAQNNGGTALSSEASVTPIGALFSDTFSNSSLDATNFASIVSGGGTVVEGASGVTMTTSANSGVAAIVYKTQLSYVNRKYTFQVAMAAGGINITAIKNAALPGAAVTTTALASSRRLVITNDGTGVLMGYENSVGDNVTWPINTLGTETLNSGVTREFVVETTAAQVRFTYATPGNFASPIAQSAWINWSAISPTNPSTDGVSMWWTIGDMVNDATFGTTKLTLFKIESF